MEFFNVYQVQYITYYINCWLGFELNIYCLHRQLLYHLSYVRCLSVMYLKLVVQAGIEPATLTLSRFCSTTELLYRKLVGYVGNAPTELLSTRFTVWTVSLTV